MRMALSMATQEAIRELVTDAPWGTVEAMAELLDIALDASRADDAEDDPEIGDGDVEAFQKGFAAFLLPSPRARGRIAETDIPDILGMKGTTMPSARARALEAMGICPVALTAMAAMVVDFDATVEGGPYDGTTVTAMVDDIGTLAAPGGRVTPCINTGAFDWGEGPLRIFDTRIPNVLMPRFEGRPLAELVDHPLTNRLDLMVAAILQEGAHLDLRLAKGADEVMLGND